MPCRDSFVGLSQDCKLSAKVQGLLNDCFGKMSPLAASVEKA